MKRKPAVALFSMMTLITLLLAACRTLTYDKLPSNVPKGYVEFYSLGFLTGFAGNSWWVFKYEDGKETGRVIPSKWSGGRQRRRIAERPGMHTFAVCLGTAEEEITVEVVEGMITPVRVYINPGKVAAGYRQTTYYFNMHVVGEKPIPFVK